ncbi:MAG: hypothetical protein JWO86_1342 [Myxococcaceae bacterium]|nr:hypothetical protein [Myxococcaceae bacterium]MEA2753087.1 hypothetical protein [Myxococcales bacterium]
MPAPGRPRGITLLRGRYEAWYDGPEMHARVALLGALSVCVSLLDGCGHGECSCFPAAGLTIDAPPDAVRAVKTSGAACSDAQLSCPENASAAYPTGCARTVLFGRRAGSCDVEIDFKNGEVFKRSVTLVETATGCCGSSFVTANPGEATIDLVSAVDAGGDAH